MGLTLRKTSKIIENRIFSANCYENLKLKVETNYRVHFSVMGWHKFPFTVDSPWFQGSREITTYLTAGNQTKSFIPKTKRTRFI